MKKTDLLITKSEVYDLINEYASKEDGVTFIFGAGASYGYSNNNNLNHTGPPVVADLFNTNNDIVEVVMNSKDHDFIKGHRSFLVEKLKDFDNDLESYLSFLFNKDPDDETFSAILLYIHDICWLASREIDTNHNNYKDLINIMTTLRGRLPWSCITFNYDTILEKSFIKAGRDRSRNFTDSENYLKKNPKVLKIHGGINHRFVLKEPKKKPKKRESEVFADMMQEKRLPSSNSVIQGLYSKIPDFYSETPEWNQAENRQVFIHEYNYPLMMVPIHETKNPAHPFFDDIQQEAVREIDASSLIISIGYNFGDDLFLERLKDVDLSEKILLMVGLEDLHLNPEAHIGYQNVINGWKDAEVKIFKGNGFKQFVEAIISQDTNTKK